MLLVIINGYDEESARRPNPGKQRIVLAKVAPQSEAPDVLILARQRREHLPRAVRAEIIHKHKLAGAARIADRATRAVNDRADGLRTVIGRDHDGNFGNF